MPEFTDEQRKVLDRASKMLQLAAGNKNPHEASVATEKAMSLLAAYNLDMATVEREGGKDGRREDTKVRGGLYHWQRDLWKRVAELNFCYYFPLNRFDIEKKMKGGKKGGYVFEHRLVGRVVNTQSTIVMAQYLEGEIERIARERFHIMDIFTKPAIAYREGMADEVQYKLLQARRELLREEEERQQQAYEDAKTKGTVPPGFQLTLGSLQTAEQEANDDFLHGEGYTAKRKAEEVRRAEARRIAMEEHTRWAEENPEEAAAKAKADEEADREWYKKYRSRGGGPGSRGGYADAREKRQAEHGSYYRQGQDRGKSISINRQSDDASAQRKRLR